MSKTFNELMEDVASATSINPAGTKPDGVDRGMDRYTVDHMIKYAEQISHAFQPEMPQLLAHIETELNKFGYTLGQLDDMEDEDEDEGDDDLNIFQKATREPVMNVYVNLDWERLESGQHSAIRPDGAKLVLSVTMTMMEVSQEEMEAIMKDVENQDNEIGDGDNDSDDIDADTETGFDTEND